MLEWLFGDPLTVTSPEGMVNAGLLSFPGQRAITDDELLAWHRRQWQEYAHWAEAQAERSYRARAATLDARFADFKRRLDAALRDRCAD